MSRVLPKFKNNETFYICDLGVDKIFKYQIDPEDGTPYKKQYDPRKYLRIGEESMVERLDEAFQDLGSVGRTLAS